MQGKCNECWWPCRAWWSRWTCPAHSFQYLQQTQRLASGILMAWLLPGVSRNYGRDWLPARPEEDQGSPGLALKGHPAPELMVAMTKDYPNDVIYGATSGGSAQGDSCLLISPPAGEKKRGLCVGSVWQRARGNTEKQIKTFLEDGTRERIALRAKRVSLGSQRCHRASCKMSHTTLLVCFHSDLSLVLKISRH